MANGKAHWYRAQYDAKAFEAELKRLVKKQGFTLIHEWCKLIQEVQRGKELDKGRPGQEPSGTGQDGAGRAVLEPQGG